MRSGDLIFFLVEAIISRKDTTRYHNWMP